MPLVYDFDGFRLEPNERRLHFRGSPVKLTAKALAILTLHAERAPRVVSRQEFESAVWPEGFIEPANLTQTIYMLRRALGRFACLAPIETVNGCGYRLNAKVTPREVSIAFDPFRKPATRSCSRRARRAPRPSSKHGTRARTRAPPSPRSSSAIRTRPESSRSRFTRRSRTCPRWTTTTSAWIQRWRGN